MVRGNGQRGAGMVCTYVWVHGLPSVECIIPDLERVMIHVY